MPDKVKSRSKKKRSLVKKILSRLLVGAVNRINITGIMERVAHSESGSKLLDRFREMPVVWDNAEEIKTLAVDLTIAQLKKEDASVTREEIQDLVNEIAIRYDRKIHEESAATLGLAFNHLFEQQNPLAPFTSPDGRDLKHLDQLKAYRDQGLGVVYLINHSSHLDEFLVDVLWQYLSMGLPVFAAGQNMMAVKSIEKLLMVGSYVVLRQGASRHQVAALFNYCSAVSRLGGQQGIFLEAWRGGARTRDGSLRYPKRLVTLKGAIQVEGDMVIQPVALSYSAVPEDLMMCSRKSARSWIRGMGLLRTLVMFPLHPKSFLWRAAENLYGRAYISVPPPMLLSDLKKDHARDKTGITLDEYIALESIREIARSKKIMASQLTARALVQARKNNNPDLTGVLASEMEAIREYHRVTFGEEPDFEDFISRESKEDVVKDGLRTLKKRGVLSRFVKEENGLPRVNDEIALSYYATHGDRRLYSPTADQNIVVVGAGNWGFAFAFLVGNRLLEDKKYNNASVAIFDSRQDVVKHMGLNRQGPGRFSEVMLPKNVFVTSDHPSAFRKASEVIIASKPEDFEARVREILTTSEQPLKIIIATRGFIPGMNCLPFTAVRTLVNEYERRDVDIIAVAGPVESDDLIEFKPVKGLLAGSSAVISQLADLFEQTPVEAVMSTDPIGVQAADILARVYAIWVNYMIASRQIDPSADIGYLMTAVSREALDLALALGANPGTFSAASAAWNATLIGVSLKGAWRDFGIKAGRLVKKGKNPAKVVSKLNQQWINEGTKLQSLIDIQEILACAAARGVRMPVMEEISRTFFNDDTDSPDQE